MVTPKDFDCKFENKWCPGCGNFRFLRYEKCFCATADPPEKLTLISGIGQAGKTPHFLKCNMFHGLHGRALPVATGTKIANNDLTVVVNCGMVTAMAKVVTTFLRQSGEISTSRFWCTTTRFTG